MKVFVIDMAVCNGCYNCQIACKDEHVDNEWLPYSLPQPDTGHFWCKVNETEHGSTPKVRVEYRPTMCNHCDNAPCIESHPDVFYRRDDGLVILDPAKADDEDLLMACPFGAIYWNEELRIAQKCTGCAHLVDDGKLPHCVDLCVIGAMKFGEESEFAEEIAEADHFIDKGYGPRIYYLNMPRLFIGGEVWDERADEVIEGAKITLASTNGSAIEALSDNFGDFWFKKLDPGQYDLTIDADGYKTVEMKAIQLDRSLNVGDFPLVKVQGE